MYDERAVSTIKDFIIKTAIFRAKGGDHWSFQGRAFYKLLQEKSGYRSTDLNLALEYLLEEKFLSGRFTKGPFELHGNITVQIPKQDLPQNEKDWQEVLEKHCKTEGDTLALGPAGAKLNGFSIEEMTSILKSLYRLKVNQNNLAGKALYNISAQYLLGSSKLLSTLQSEVKAFGINTEIFTPSYRYISVAGNKDPEAVIIVENPHCFETAVNADINLQYSWISSYGFGIALEKDLKYGELLVTNLNQTNQESTILLTRKGNPGFLSQLLSHPRIFFWGDLDLGGLQIYLNLKRNVPNLRLSGIYNSLVQELNSGNAHPYTKAVSKNGQKTFYSKCLEVQELLESCRTHAVDQEAIKIEDIMKYAGREYQMR